MTVQTKLLYWKQNKSYLKNNGQKFRVKDNPNPENAYIDYDGDFTLKFVKCPWLKNSSLWEKENRPPSDILCLEGLLKIFNRIERGISYEETGLFKLFP